MRPGKNRKRLKIKKGDEVLVIAGRNRGTRSWPRCAMRRLTVSVLQAAIPKVLCKYDPVMFFEHFVSSADRR